MELKWQLYNISLSASTDDKCVSGNSALLNLLIAVSFIIKSRYKFGVLNLSDH